jgi:hypothetical protein
MGIIASRLWGSPDIKPALLLLMSNGSVHDRIASPTTALFQGLATRPLISPELPVLDWRPWDASDQSVLPADLDSMVNSPGKP